jgi:hypothetical protein
MMSLLTFLKSAIFQETRLSIFSVQQWFIFWHLIFSDTLYIKLQHGFPVSIVASSSSSQDCHPSVHIMVFRSPIKHKNSYIDLNALHTKGVDLEQWLLDVGSALLCFCVTLFSLFVISLQSRPHLGI